MSAPIPANILADAQRAQKAARKKDWSLHAMICRRYPFGSAERRQFETACQTIAGEYREARGGDK